MEDSIVMFFPITLYIYEGKTVMDGHLEGGGSDPEIQVSTWEH
jgi:hypothetical protein